MSVLHEQYILNQVNQNNKQISLARQLHARWEQISSHSVNKLFSFHCAFFENPIFGTCEAGRNCDSQPQGRKFKGRVANRTFVPLYRYRKSISQNSCYEIVYYITRDETERLHECEVCCPSETRAAITRNAFAVFCFE